MVNLNHHSNFHYMNELRSPNESSSMFFSKITSKFGLGCKRLNNLNDLTQMNNDYKKLDFNTDNLIRKWAY